MKMAELGRDIDDGAAAGLAHGRRRIFAHDKSPGVIDAQGLLPFLERQGFRRAIRGHRSGCVYEGCEATIGLDRARHRRLRAEGVAYVHLQRQGLASSGPDVSSGLLRLRKIKIRHSHASAFSGKAAGDG